MSDIEGPKIVKLADLRDRAQPPALSDEDLALRFAAKNGDCLRYVHQTRRWFRWDETRWCYDATRHAEGLARKLCREASTTNSRVASRAKVAAVVDLASMDQRLSVEAKIWDRMDHLFNQEAQTIDLSTGEGYAPRREDYITKAAGVPHAGGPCALWLKFLDRVTDGNDELQRYLQRVAGYCLTGHTSEHVFFFLYGTGANGKSIFCNTLQGILGEYACSAGIETFTESRNDRHPTELARLDGVRLAIASETSAGSRWNEARIKTITGGDVISARFMRGDFFEFTPKFKLMVMGNRRPSLRQVDEAMRRRMHLVPFTVEIPPAERDLQLAEKLREEWPGILQWAIDGCTAWHEQGLAPPKAVIEATDAYLEAENIMANWLADCCTPEATAWEASKALYGSWKEWCDENGERPGGGKAFAQQLEANGGVMHPKNYARGFFGFRLK